MSSWDYRVVFRHTEVSSSRSSLWEKAHTTIYVKTRMGLPFFSFRIRVILDGLIIHPNLRLLLKQIIAISGLKKMEILVLISG